MCVQFSPLPSVLEASCRCRIDLWRQVCLRTRMQRMHWKCGTLLYDHFATKVILFQLASVETAYTKLVLIQFFNGFFENGKCNWYTLDRTHAHWPDNGEKDGSTADEVNQKEDLLPQIVFTGAFLCGLDDDVCNISQDLEDNGWVSQQKQNSPGVNNDTQLFRFSSTHTPAEGWQSWRSSFPCQTGCISRKPSRCQSETVWWRGEPPWAWKVQHKL